ncbi:MAG: hypothetical protein GF411_13555 [Candidatus Lokiarchaeota archaeon]|nr:hypothetical protein [Candidatus Lokiarchaeota archaeon]
MRDKGAKRAANRKLHIDDGCMGGGGSLGLYEEEIYWQSGGDTTRKSGATDDFKDFKGTGSGTSPYFDWSNRKDIFHYCLIVNTYIKTDGSKPVGTAEKPGDDIIIAHSEVPSGATNFARVFMHELGHNLKLEHAPGDSTTVMSIIKKSHIDDSTIVDYSNDEWDPSDGDGIELKKVTLSSD